MTRKSASRTASPEYRGRPGLEPPPPVTRTRRPPRVEGGLVSVPPYCLHGRWRPSGPISSTDLCPTRAPGVSLETVVEFLEKKGEGGKCYLGLGRASTLWRRLGWSSGDSGPWYPREPRTNAHPSIHPRPSYSPWTSPFSREVPAGSAPNLFRAATLRRE